MGYFAYYIIDFPVKLRLLSDSNRNLQTIFFITTIQHQGRVWAGVRQEGADSENPAALQSISLVAPTTTC